ncbi:MAG TPA: nitrogenase cofactor biosynthesis protein NifB [Firmicutes bacterium]|jgi:nitrogen fixation protein NifB|nr:nitrogenase cofactor biosynthesis protein NifB [Bacillota bacterium]
MECSCMSSLGPNVSKELSELTARHPCYSFEAHRQFARMHLPVAPNCNVQCNYCNRKYDCVNESRPGVTSEILAPEAARDKFIRVKQALSNLSVVGIAGPGDALANWDQVKQSIRFIKNEDSDCIFCLSTNGLMLPQYGPEIIELGVKHVTVTVNCVNPVIGAGIYHHVDYQGQRYIGEEAAEILMTNQMAGVKYLAENGVLVKINIVMIPDLNADHIPLVVKKVKRLGAVLTNIMPLIPAIGSAFEKMPQTRMKDIQAMRELCRTDITQMEHCQQCRADAIGRLTEDLSYQFSKHLCASQPEFKGAIKGKTAKYKVAVTSKYKKLVDLHYGHAEDFHIYEVDGNYSTFLETRKIQKYCTGRVDCDDSEAMKDLAVKTIADCNAVLTMRIGYNAQKKLIDHGIAIIESCNTVEEGLKEAARRLEMKPAI